MYIDNGLLYETVRQRIKAVRTAEGDNRLTQAGLGEFLGMKRSTIANVEAGAQRASLHNVYQICAHYRLDLADLLPSIEEMRRRSADLKYVGIGPGLSHVLEKLQRKE